MMFSGEGITVSLAGLPIHVDCEPEHVDYCLHLTALLEPRARTILEAAPDISLTELLFLLALSLADEVYGSEGRCAPNPQPDPIRIPEDGEHVSLEQRALNTLFHRLRG